MRVPTPRLQVLLQTLAPAVRNGQGVVRKGIGVDGTRVGEGKDDWGGCLVL
jgi:hypothetical protein